MLTRTVRGYTCIHGMCTYVSIYTPKWDPFWGVTDGPWIRGRILEMRVIGVEGLVLD